MKYWKEKESNPVEKMEFWKGEYITKLEPNEIFVMGTNPSGIHGAGAAKAGLKFGAKILQGRGLVGSTYGLITKNLEGKEGFVEKATGIVYHKAGFRSVSPEQIRDNIDEMYAVARKPEHKDKKFLITYQYNTWANGSPKKSLNGYDSQEILELFAKDKDVPPNIVFHESYKPHLEKLYKNQNKQSNGELVVYEDDKTIDIKEEYIIWTIDEDERNPQARHFAGAAKSALGFGAVPINVKQNKPGIARGLSPNNKTFALITKSLEAGYTEPETGITYHKEGFQSVSPEQIRANVDELYETAKKPDHLDKKFLVTYQYEAWPNGTPKKSLNGYTSQEMLEMFAKDKDVPPNIVFHESYKPHLEKLLKNTEYKKENNNLKSELNISDNLIVISPRDNVPEEFTVINTTSQDKSGLGKKFSPFYLSNIELYEGHVAKNMENAWQFSKVYKEFADDNGSPSEEYFEWAKKGWNDSFAHRYANGKGNVPLYSFWKTYDTENNTWQEHKLDYVTARKNIYFPLYAKAIINTPAFQELEQRLQKGEKIALWDFDGYDHQSRKMTYEDVVNSSQYKCGHAFVLYGLLTKQLKLINNELVFDFKNEIIMNNKESSEQKIQGYTYFFQATSPFSQWHPSLFTYKELDFICAEQFMMYAKAKTFGDETVANKIINIEKCYLNPQGTIQTEYGNFKTEADKACYDLIVAFKKEKINRKEVISYKNLNTWKTVQGLIKKLGREVSNYNDVVWNSKRKSVVSVASREKYNQNADLKEILMSTNETIMVEASPYDKIWGIGLSEADAKKITPEKWPGLNLLGEILTDLKEYYRNELNNNKKMKM